jgi:hypothetical protein
LDNWIIVYNYLIKIEKIKDTYSSKDRYKLHAKTTMAAGGMSEEAYMKMMGITPKVQTAVGEVVDLMVRPADPVGLSAAIDRIFKEYFTRLKTLAHSEQSYFTSHIRDPFVRHFS